ncbi:MAG: endonuclease domain-containing protein [Bacteroidaceae bacterium]|nr:endonuclease domain-containing protein [Bacteroidaceae bacterium]
MEKDYGSFEGFVISQEYRTSDPAWYPLLKELAKKNRRNPTEAESLMWDLLRSYFPDTKFRRQHIIGDYIVDFVSLYHNLVIEIDGGYHKQAEQALNDEYRTKWLEKHNDLTVIRFNNEEVLFNSDAVISTLSERLKEIEKCK